MKQKSDKMLLPDSVPCGSHAKHQLWQNRVPNTTSIRGFTCHVLLQPLKRAPETMNKVQLRIVRKRQQYAGAWKDPEGDGFLAESAE